MVERFHGTFPILPTAFDKEGNLDEESLRRVVDFVIEGGVLGAVTLANASEGFALSDDERKAVTKIVIDQAAGRIPILVAVSHPSTKVCIERAQAAQEAGAAGVLCLPPFFGTWNADGEGIFNHFRAMSENIGIPIMIQDHPLSNVPLPAPLLARMAQEIEHVKYFKIECPRAALKIARVLELAGDSVEGIFGGMNGVCFIQELDRGPCGTMPSSAFPTSFSQVYQLYTDGKRDEALKAFARLLPAISFEWELGGKQVHKELLYAGGIIASPHVRGPVRVGWDDTLQAQLMELTKDLDCLALRNAQQDSRAV